jgi:hypothetical protein
MRYLKLNGTGVPPDFTGNSISWQTPPATGTLIGTFPYTVKGSCSVLESQGGIFDDCDGELKVRNRLVSGQSSIHRLYYEAEAVFGDIKPVNDCGGGGNKQAPTLREKLCRLTSEMVARGIFMCPIISIAEAFISECLETDKIPSEIIEYIDLQWLTVDFCVLKFIPDGDNLWRIKGICS